MSPRRRKAKTMAPPASEPMQQERRRMGLYAAAGAILIGLAVMIGARSSSSRLDNLERRVLTTQRELDRTKHKLEETTRAFEASPVRCSFLTGVCDGAGRPFSNGRMTAGLFLNCWTGPAIDFESGGGPPRGHNRALPAHDPDRPINDGVPSRSRRRLERRRERARRPSRRARELVRPRFRPRQEDRPHR